MKAWIRDNYYMDKIPAKRLKDNALVRIFPLRDDPADSTSSQRFPIEDRVETIVWHGEEYEVFSVDLQWQNSHDIISPTSFKPITKEQENA
jgi:phage-related protein